MGFNVEDFSRPKKEKYLFLYLNTGNGHKAPAMALKEELEKNYNAEVLLMPGFAPKQVIARSFFEDGYHATTAAMPAAYSAFYDITTNKIVLRLCKAGCTVVTQFYLRKILKKHQITKVVCFHFAVGPAAKRAIQAVNPKIPYIVNITDPFTAHPAWYLVKNASFIAYSNRLKDEMVQNHGIKAEKIGVFPFIIGAQFFCETDASVIDRYKAANGIPLQNKCILLAGGGEGLPGAAKILGELCRKIEPGENISIIAVCGRNKSQHAIMNRQAKIHKNVDVHVLGFVGNMHELIKISDCVVTKAGASMMMQILACQKPSIFTTYIHGQEKGNIEYVLQNEVGWFSRSPQKNAATALRLCRDQIFAHNVALRLAKLNVKPDVPQIAKYIVEVEK